VSLGGNVVFFKARGQPDSPGMSLQGDSESAFLLRKVNCRLGVWTAGCKDVIEDLTICEISDTTETRRWAWLMCSNLEPAPVLHKEGGVRGRPCSLEAV
jgi:hypothetical protein